MAPNRFDGWSVPFGFVNQEGTNCFMNAVFVMIMCCPSIMHYLMKDSTIARAHYKKQTTKKNTSDSKQKQKLKFLKYEVNFYLEFVKIVAEARNIYNNEILPETRNGVAGITTDDMSSVRSESARLLKNFKNWAETKGLMQTDNQQDAQEAFQHLIDILFSATSQSTIPKTLLKTDELLKAEYDRALDYQQRELVMDESLALQIVNDSQDDETSEIFEENVRIVQETQYAEVRYKNVHSYLSVVETVYGHYSSLMPTVLSRYLIKTKCDSCTSCSFKFEVNPMLTLGLPKKYAQNRQSVSDWRQQKVVTLESLLDNYFAPTKLSGDNMYFCETCNDHVNAEQSWSILQSPNVVFIQLKRYEYIDLGHGQFTLVKNHCPVKYGHELDLSDYMETQESQSSSSEDSSLKYKLVAVVRHGGQLNGGHYICNGYFEHFWVSFSDDSGYFLSRDEVCAEDAYILAYHKVERK